MRKYNDLSGKRFGRLIAIKRAEDKVAPSGCRSPQYLCQCDCGKQKIISAGSLRNGKTKSCGCYKREQIINRCSTDLTGKRFGRLVVIRSIDVMRKNGHIGMQWLCRCDCGNEVKVETANLTSGHTQSCGCRKSDIISECQSIDLMGKQFGYLTAIKPAYRRSKKETLKWECICKCGNHTTVATEKLISGDTQSCGCLVKERIHETTFKDLTGKRFGKLIVIKLHEIKRYGNGQQKTLWECQCDCGNRTIVSTGSLRSGKTVSCGCIKSGIELSVTQISQELGLPLKSQIIFDGLCGCKGKHLSYDFGLYTNGVLRCLIECQGKQHYKPIPFFGGTEAFAIQQEHDKRKRNYALQHNIPLVEIPYTDSRDDIYRKLVNLKALYKAA